MTKILKYSEYFVPVKKWLEKNVDDFSKKGLAASNLSLDKLYAMFSDYSQNGRKIVDNLINQHQECRKKIISILKELSGDNNISEEDLLNKLFINTRPTELMPYYHYVEATTPRGKSTFERVTQDLVKMYVVRNSNNQEALISITKRPILAQSIYNPGVYYLLYKDAKILKPFSNRQYYPLNMADPNKTYMVSYNLDTNLKGLLFKSELINEEKYDDIFMRNRNDTIYAQKNNKIGVINELIFNNGELNPVPVKTELNPVPIEFNEVERVSCKDDAKIYYTFNNGFNGAYYKGKKERYVYNDASEEMELQDSYPYELIIPCLVNKIEYIGEYSKINISELEDNEDVMLSNPAFKIQLNGHEGIYLPTLNTLAIPLIFDPYSIKNFSFNYHKSYDTKPANYDIFCSCEGTIDGIPFTFNHGVLTKQEIMNVSTYNLEENEKTLNLLLKSNMENTKNIVIRN